MGPGIEEYKTVLNSAKFDRPRVVGSCTTVLLVKSMMVLSILQRAPLSYLDAMKQRSTQPRILVCTDHQIREEGESKERFERLRRRTRRGGGSLWVRAIPGLLWVMTVLCAPSQAFTRIETGADPILFDLN